MKQKRKLLIFMLIAAIIVGILLFSALISKFMQMPDDAASPLMFSENTYVILVFALLLPVALIAMIRHIVKTHDSYFHRIRDKEEVIPENTVLPEV